VTSLESGRDILIVYEFPSGAIRKECIGDESQYHFRTAYMYRPIAMRLDGVWLSQFAFENGRASVLTSRRNSGVGKKTTISLTYIFDDVPLVLTRTTPRVEV